MTIKQITVTKDDPKGPRIRPNNPAQIEPINGKKINNKYIKTVQIINLNCSSNRVQPMIYNLTLGNLIILMIDALDAIFPRISNISL